LIDSVTGSEYPYLPVYGKKPITPKQGSEEWIFVNGIDWKQNCYWKAEEVLGKFVRSAARRSR
jgi:hypothetical protein